MSYIVGLDVGGTFTDCVVVDPQGEIVTDKTFTTPDNTALGMIQSIENTGKSLDMPVTELLQQTGTLALGTTTLTNLLIRRGGAKVGLLTTRGHEDATLIGRVMSKTEGLPEEEKLDILAWDKPVPLVPKALIKGVTERVDYKGTVVVRLARDEVERAADELMEAGVEAIAISFLWSFMYPGGGYGDPIEREPESVLLDLVNDLVSPGLAEKVYGVCANLSGNTVNHEATGLRRAAILEERKNRSHLPTLIKHPPSATPSRILNRVNAYLSIASIEGELYFQCRCSLVLCYAHENYKEHIAWAEVPSSAAGPFTHSSAEFCLREFYCPGCYTLLDVEVIQKGAPITKDVALAVR